MSDSQVIEPADNHPSSTSSSEAPIQKLRRCLHCGYSLRGLSGDRQCPECGFHVSYSITLMHFLDPVWLAKVGQGLALLMVGCLIIAATMLVVLPILRTSEDYRFMGLPYLLGLLGIAFSAVGIWSFTAYERGLMEHREVAGPPRFLRGMVRFFVTFAPLILSMRHSSGTPLHWAVSAAAGIFVTDGPAAVLVACTLCYLAWIATLASNAALARRLRWAAGISGIFIIGTAIAPWNVLLNSAYSGQFQFGYRIGGHDILLICDGLLAWRGIAVDPRDIPRGPANAVEHGPTLHTLFQFAT